MVNIEPDPDELQMYFDLLKEGDPDEIMKHYELIISQQDKKIKELEGIIELIKQDCNDKASY